MGVITAALLKTCRFGLYSSENVGLVLDPTCLILGGF